MIKIDLEMKNMLVKYPELWTKKILKRNIVFHNAGEIATENYYVETGTIKAFVYNADNFEEVIIDFFEANTAILPYRGFPVKSLTMFNLQTIANTIVHTISADNWEKLRKKEPMLDVIIGKDSLRTSSKSVKKSLIYSYPDAQTCYEKALEFYPCLNNLSDTLVGQFIGYDRTTINRVKTKYLSK